VTEGRPPPMSLAMMSSPFVPVVSMPQ